MVVTSSPQPGDEPLATRGLPFHGAGLIAWQNPRTYVRLERAAITRQGQRVHYVNYQVFRDGRAVDGVNAELPDAPTHLRLQRRGGQVLAATSRDGTTWNELKPITVELADDLKVGVAAVNTSAAPWEAKLEGFVLEGGGARR